MKELPATIKSLLCGAIRDDDVISVISYLKNKDYLETPIDSKGNAPMAVAVLHKSHKVIQFLLRMGAMTTTTNADTLSAFDLASLREDILITRTFLFYNHLNTFFLKITQQFSENPSDYKLPAAQKLIQILILAGEEKNLKRHSELASFYQKLDIVRTLRSLFMIAKFSQNETQFRMRLHNFFARREEFIQNTEMDYCFSPHSLINKICFQAAELLIPTQESEIKADEPKGPYDYLLAKRLNTERQEWQQWQNNLEGTGVLPQNIALVLCWRDPESKFTYGEVHYVPEILKIAIDNMKQGEINYDRIWYKQDPKGQKDCKEKNSPLPRSTLYIMRQWGEAWSQLVDYSLNMDRIRKDPHSIMGRFNELCEGLYRGSKNGTGTELKADVTARDAVGVFSEWFASLDTSDQQEIMSWNSLEITQNMGEILKFLEGSPEPEIEIISADFCVDILGTQMRKIILFNEQKIGTLQNKLTEKQSLKEQTLIKEYKENHLKSPEELEKIYQQALKEIESPERPDILINNSEADDQFAMNIDLSDVTEPLIYELVTDFERLSQNKEPLDILTRDFLGMTLLKSAQQNECLELFRPKIHKMLFETIREEGASLLIIKEIINYYPDLLHVPFARFPGIHTYPLISAAFYNQLEIIDFFISQDADIFFTDSNNQTAKEVAELKNHFAVLEKLKAALQHLLRKSLLKAALQHLLRKSLVEDNKDAPEKILAQCPDCVDTLYANETLWTWALKIPQNIKVLEFLAKININIFQKNSAGESPLKLAKRFNRLDEFQAVAHRNFLMCLQKGQPAQMQEIASYYPEFTYLPFSDRDFYPADKMTVIMYTVYYEYEHTFITFLKDSHIELDSRHGDEKTIQLLNNNLRSNKKITPILQILALRNALETQNIRICEKVLKNNPTFIHDIVLNGQTSLTFLLTEAAKNNIAPSVVIIELWLCRGASLLKKNSFGQHPLQMIVNRNWLSVMFNLQGKLSNEFYQAIENGNLAQSGEILKYCPEFINQPLKLSDGNFTTPLILAALEGDPAMVEFLLHRGADILAVDSKNCSVFDGDLEENILNLLYKPCLEQALKTRNLGIIKKIFGIYINSTQTRLTGGETLLTFTLKQADDNADCIQCLLEEKMDIFTLNYLGESPLAIAQEKGRLPEFLFIARQKFSAALIQGDLIKIDEILSYYPSFLNQPLIGNDYQDTPLMTAAFRGHEDIVKFLLQDSKIIIDEHVILGLEIANRLTKPINDLLQTSAFEKVLRDRGPEEVYDIILSKFPQLLNEIQPFLASETPVTHAIKFRSKKLLDMVSHANTNVFSKNWHGESPFYLIRVLHIQYLERQITKKIKLLKEVLATLENQNKAVVSLRLELSDTKYIDSLKLQTITAELKSFHISCMSSSFFNQVKTHTQSLEDALLEYKGLGLT